MAGPAIDTTQRVLFTYGPRILRADFFERYQATPGMAKRLQAAPGPHKSGDDPHAQGRALDIILFANRPWERRVANDLVQVFLRLRPQMAWGGLIYNEWEWNSAGTQSARQQVCDVKPSDSEEVAAKKKGKLYSCLHYSHIHIEWGLDSEGISKTDFESELVTAVQLVPDASEYKLPGIWQVTIGNFNGKFIFNEDFSVAWTDDSDTSNKKHPGNWKATPTAIEWKFKDDPPGYQRTFQIPLPVAHSNKGEVLPVGKGFFEMNRLTKMD